jgi:hypothetical protein
LISVLLDGVLEQLDIILMVIDPELITDYWSDRWEQLPSCFCKGWIHPANINVHFLDISTPALGTTDNRHTLILELSEPCWATDATHDFLCLSFEVKAKR